MSDEIKNVFVSHIHEDDAVVPELKELIAREGCSVRDGSITSSKPNEAEDPEYIKHQILAPRIDWASTLMVLISPDTHAHWWVDWEIECAAQKGKRIVGVWDRGAKDSDLPANLEKYANAIVGWQAERVVAAINGELNNWYTVDGSEHPPRDIRRYSCA